MTFLRLSDVTASYGDAQALFGINLTIEPGEAVALMGRNGMGKTTTIKTLCGLVPATSGQIVFDGHDLRRLPSHRIGRLGIGLVPEGRRCFSTLSVRENLTAAMRPGHWSYGGVVQLFPRLAEREAQIASSLSGGEQQMLAIGRALMTNPRLLILDEATEGLAPIVRHEIWAVVRKLKQESALSLLVVDKSIKELRQIANRATLIERGSTVWDGSIEDLTPELANRYLGV